MNLLNNLANYTTYVNATIPYPSTQKNTIPSLVHGTVSGTAMFERTKKTHTEKPDPLTYSTLPPESIVSSRIVPDIDRLRRRLRKAGLNEDVGDVVELQGSDGNTYYELPENRSPQRQLFHSRLLHGILHIAEIIPFTDTAGTTRYLSRKTPLADINTPLTKQQIKAEIAILHFLFLDYDHDFDTRRNIDIERAWTTNPFMWRVALFDLEGVGDKVTVSQPQGVRESTKGTDVNYVLSLLHQLKERISGTEGTAFVQAIADSILGPDDDKKYEKLAAAYHETTSYCDYLNRRIDIAIQALTTPSTRDERRDWKTYLDQDRENNAK